LHTRTTPWAFVTDHYHFPCFYFSAEDMFDSLILTFNDMRRPFENPGALINAGSLHYATVDSNVAMQNSETALFGISVIHRANTTGLPVVIKGRPAGRLSECYLGRDARRASIVEVSHLVRICGDDIPMIQRVLQRLAVDCRHLIVQ